jgi:hypothetical protein
VLWNYFHLTLFFLLSLFHMCGKFFSSPRATPNQNQPPKQQTNQMNTPNYTATSEQIKGRWIHKIFVDGKQLEQRGTSGATPFLSVWASYQTPKYTRCEYRRTADGGSRPHPNSVLVPISSI